MKPEPQTKQALRILHLEDDPKDNLLIARALAAQGLICEFVHTRSRSEFESAGGSEGEERTRPRQSASRLECRNAIESLRRAAGWIIQPRPASNDFNSETQILPIWLGEAVFELAAIGPARHRPP